MDEFDVAAKGVDLFDKQLERVINDLYKSIRDLVFKLQIKDGNVVTTKFNLNMSASIYNELERALAGTEYEKVYLKLQGIDNDLIAAIVREAKIPISFTKTSVEVVDALRNLQMTEFQHIGERGLEAVREELMRSVLNGVPISETLDNIRDALESKFQRYAQTYAWTSRQELMQAVHNEGAKGYPADEIFWEYVGPDDNLTRPACQELLAQRYFANEEKEEAIAKYAEERAYNCRHVFVQIAPEDYYTATGKEPNKKESSEE